MVIRHAVDVRVVDVRLCERSLSSYISRLLEVESLIGIDFVLYLIL